MVFFEEQQKFRQWWLMLILIVINATFLFGCYQQIVGGIQFGDQPLSNIGLLSATVLTFLVSSVFYFFRLDTTVTKEGINTRFFPFQRKYRTYAWNDISKIYIRKYNALAEYGGWGVRMGMKGKAFNISGNMGLQLVFFNKNELLIGTKKPDGPIAAIKQARLD